jgi:hypothetical protein
VLNLSQWKYSFELVNRELDLTEKKKKALDNLYGSKKISQSTYDYLENELTKALNEFDDHLNTLREKMSERSQELEKQASTLEMFLASLEIHYAAGDVEEETYQAQNNAIILGLEATKQELDDIKSSSLETISKNEDVVWTKETNESVQTADINEVETYKIENLESTEIVEEKEQTITEEVINIEQNELSTQPSQGEIEEPSSQLEEVIEQPSQGEIEEPSSQLEEVIESFYETD